MSSDHASEYEDGPSESEGFESSVSDDDDGLESGSSAKDGSSGPAKPGAPQRSKRSTPANPGKGAASQPSAATQPRSARARSASSGARTPAGVSSAAQGQAASKAQATPQLPAAEAPGVDPSPSIADDLASSSAAARAAPGSETSSKASLPSSSKASMPDGTPGAGDTPQGPESGEEAKRRREQNIKAMLSDTVEVERQAMLPHYLKIREAEKLLKQPFGGVREGKPAQSTDLKRRLSAMRRFVPWGGGGNFVPAHLKALPLEEEENADEAAAEPEAEAAAVEPLPDGVEPMYVWQPGEGQEGAAIRVDDMLTKFLRAHQREGLQFLFDCVTGQKGFDGRGCILADDMGLGKTLQGIALMWTLLKSGHESLGGTPVVKRAMIVCPTSLVNNWDSECNKWLQGRCKTLPLCESSRDDIIHSVRAFLGKARPHDVLIVSYETFRIHAKLFENAAPIDLLLCDEAHRLKNDDTKTNKALDSLTCRRRVLLSGTPMQNHLDEFFAMVNFCNPGVLGSPASFRKHFESPILASREPGASAEVLRKGEERSEELSGIVNAFILRRTNKLLSEFQPPKLVEVVCCKMTELQRSIYNHYLESKAAARLLNQGKGGTKVLGAITALKKLCNHPKLVYDVIHSKQGLDGFQGCDALFPPGVFDDGRPGRGGLAAGWEALSGKFAVLAQMLDILWNRTRDKIVIVSNYTQTLDLITTLCRANDYPFVRLDGSTSINKRQKLVESFCDATQRNFVFLLSSKAGGCGLNLIGANRLVLFDPDWNPATDKQAAARVWRNGQKKHVYVYRLLATGTLEEKVFQRQLSKEGLSNVVNQSGKSAASLMSTEDLADLFTPEFDTLSSTYDSMVDPPPDEAAEAPSADAPLVRRTVRRAQVGAPTEEELKDWAWHSEVQGVDDEVLRTIGGEHISFVFTLHVPGCPVEEQCGILPDGKGHAQAGKRGAGGLCGALPRAGVRAVARKSCPAQPASAAAAVPARARSSLPAVAAGSARSVKLPGGGIPGLSAGARTQSAGASARRVVAGAAPAQRKSAGPATSGAGAAASTQQVAAKARSQSVAPASAAARTPLSETQPKARDAAGASAEKRKREPSAAKAPAAAETAKYVRVDDSDDDFA